MPEIDSEELPWYCEHPFDDTRVTWKLWLLSLSDEDLLSLQSSFQNWQELWCFFSTYRDGFVKAIPQHLVEAYREQMRNYTQPRSDASPSTRIEDLPIQKEDRSPSRTTRGRSHVNKDNRIRQFPKPILTRTRSQSPAKNVHFDPDNLEEYEPVRSVSKSRIPTLKQGSRIEKNKPRVPHKARRPRRQVPFVPRELMDLFSGAVPPPPDDLYAQEEEEAYREADSALAAAQSARIAASRKPGRPRLVPKTLQDGDDCSLSVGPGSPLKTTRSTGHASPRKTSALPQSLTPERSKKTTPRTRSTSPMKQSTEQVAARMRSTLPAKRPHSRARSTSPVLKPPSKRMTRAIFDRPFEEPLVEVTQGMKSPVKRTARPRSASPIKAATSTKESSPAPRSSSRRLKSTARVREAATSKGLPRTRKAVTRKTSTKRTGPVEVQGTLEAILIGDEPSIDPMSSPTIPMAESLPPELRTTPEKLPRVLQNYQRRPVPRNPETNPRRTRCGAPVRLFLSTSLARGQ